MPGEDKELIVRVTTNAPNNVAIVTIDQVCVPVLVDKSEDNVVCGYKMRFHKNLYEKPFPSSLLGIGVYCVSN